MLLGNTLRAFHLGGFHLAWMSRRQLLPVLLAPLALLLAGSLIVDLVLGRAQATISNGQLVAGEPSWAALALSAAIWLLTLTAATTTVVGAARGVTVSPGKAFGAAARTWPILALGLVVATSIGFGVLSVAAGAGPVVFLAAAVVLAVLGARWSLGPVTRVFGGSAWALTRGHLWRTTGAIVLGAAALPLLVLYARDGIQARVTVPGLMALIDAVLVTVVVAGQAGVLAQVYLWQREDFSGIDARLTRLGGGHTRAWTWAWTWAGAAAMLVPALLAAVITVVNPLGLPSMRSQDDGPPGGAIAVAWPAGRHPVIVSETGARFCDTDLCDRYVVRHGGPVVMGGAGTAAIAVDGAVVTAETTGSPEKGGPFIHFARCVRSGCKDAYLPVRASAKEAFGWPELAVAGAADGAVWFALAMPSPEGPGAPTYAISLIRCADVPCTQPERHPIGVVARTPDDGFAGARGRMSVGADGRPLAAFWIGHSVLMASCDAVTCANPHTTETGDVPADSVWTTPGGPGDGVVALDHDGVRIGDEQVTLANSFEDHSRALAVTASAIYATAAQPAGHPPGLHIWLGPRPHYWQQILWRCDRPRCTQPKPVDLEISASPEKTMLAVSTDGRALLVRGEHVTLVDAPKAR